VPRRTRLPLLALLLASCSGPVAEGRAGPPVAPAAPPPGKLEVRASLEDAREDRPEGRILWTVTWRLCWEGEPEARLFEIAFVSSYGAARKPLRTADRCHAIQVARGENDQELGQPRRDLLLSMQAAQLSLRVRALGADGAPGPWSDPVPAGREWPRRAPEAPAPPG